MFGLMQGPLTGSFELGSVLLCTTLRRVDFTGSSVYFRRATGCSGATRVKVMKLGLLIFMKRLHGGHPFHLQQLQLLREESLRRRLRLQGTNVPPSMCHSDLRLGEAFFVQFVLTVINRLALTVITLQ